MTQTQGDSMTYRNSAATATRPNLRTCEDYLSEAEAAINLALDYLESAATLAGSPDRSEDIQEQVQELRICGEQVEALGDN